MTFANLTTDACSEKGLAVTANGPTVASQLGYADPSQTAITALAVLDGDGSSIFADKIGEGKFLSAIFVEGWIKYRNLDRAGRPSQILFDSIARSALELYMGKKVCADARDPHMENHAFVRALLSTNETLTIQINWRH